MSNQNVNPEKDKQKEEQNQKNQEQQKKSDETVVDIDRNESYSDRSHGRVHDSPKTRRTPGTL